MRKLRALCLALGLLLIAAPVRHAHADDTTPGLGLDLSGSTDDAPKPKKKRKKKDAPAPAPTDAAPVDAAQPADAAPADAAQPDASQPDATQPDASQPADQAKPADQPKPEAAQPAPADQPKPAAADAKPAPSDAKPAPDAPKKLSLKGAAPVVAIAFEGTDPGTRDQVNRVETELAASLARDGRLTPAKVGGTPDAASAPPAANPEVAQHLKAAHDSYASLDLDGAIKEYGDAIHAGYATPETADPDQMATTWLAMGAAYQLNGDKSHADVAYKFALAIRPKLQPDANAYGPDIRNAFEAQRATLDAASQQSPSVLDIDVDGPASAEITVDGVSAGSSPVRGFKVWPGRHFVVAKAPGFVTKAAVGVAAPGESGGDVKLAMDELPEHKLLAGARERALSERGLPQPGPGVNELAQKSSATAVVLGALSSSANGTRLDLTLFDAQTGRRIAGISREAVVESARFPDFMDSLALELGNDWIEPPEDALADNGGPGGKPIYKRWYFWAGVGAAVVAGASVAYVASQPSSGHMPFGASTALGFPLTSR